MTTINVALVKPDLTPWSFAVVSVRLVDAGSGGAVEESVISSTMQIRCDADGEGSIDLTPNEDITPAGTFYAFAVENSSPATVRCIEVPDSVTALSWADPTIQVLVDDPPVFIPAPNLESVGYVPTVNGTGDGYDLVAGGSGTAASVGALIHAAASKATPVDADELALSDSSSSWVLKKLTWANLKATVKSYFDTLYATISHVHAGGDITSGTVATARLGSGTANSGTYLRGDQTWAAVTGGSGDVAGPPSATNNSLARFDGTTGKLLKDGAVIGVDVLAATATAGGDLTGNYPNPTIAAGTVTEAKLANRHGAGVLIATARVTANQDALLVPCSTTSSVGVYNAGAGVLWGFAGLAEQSVSALGISVTTSGLGAGEVVTVAIYEVHTDGGPGAVLWYEDITVGASTGSIWKTGLSRTRPTRGYISVHNKSGNAGSVTMTRITPEGSSNAVHNGLGLPAAHPLTGYGVPSSQTGLVLNGTNSGAPLVEARP